MMSYMKYGSLQDVVNHPEIRFRTVTYNDPETGERCSDFEFQVFKRPYFWGLIGKKDWEMSIQTNSFNMGLSFSKHLIGNKKQAVAA